LVGGGAAFGCAGAWVELHYATRAVPWPPGAYLLTLAAAVPLLWHRRRPVPAAVACLACVGAYHWVGYQGLAPAVLAFLVCYALGAYQPRFGLAYGLAAAAFVWVVLALPPHRLPWYAVDVSMPAVTYAAAAAVGAVARRGRLEREARVREQATVAEERLARRLAEERLTIARELHDVLAHTIAVVAVQCNAALDSLSDDPAAARRALHLARDAAKQAMPELRATLGLLRGGGDTPDPRPQPTLAQLPDLAAQVRRSGLDVDLSVDPDLAQTPAVVQLTVYRIVQEALTNVQRHARARRADVAIRRAAHGLTAQIDDDGIGADGAPPGFGLTGMRERIETLNGTFRTGRGPRGGFLVRAELPWDTR